MSRGRILLISDNLTINKAVDTLLRFREYEVTVAADSHQALSQIKSGFDFIILLQGLTGCDIKYLIRQLIQKDPLVLISLLVENKDITMAEEFPQNGIFEIVTLPLNIEKFTFLIRAAIEIHNLNLAHRKAFLGLEERSSSLQKQNILLARRIEETTHNLTRLYDDLRSTYMRTVRCLVEAIDARDHYTRSHSDKVERYAIIMAEELGLSLKEKEAIRQACELHDVGKIGIDDRILTKPGPLDDKEWEQIKLHAVKGAQILEPLTFLGDVVSIVRQHHERYDGKGYPEGLKAKEIILGARIVSLADAYDVMTSLRAYRTVVFSKEEAIEEIKRNSGIQFDPEMVAVFLKVVDKF